MKYMEEIYVYLYNSKSIQLFNQYIHKLFAASAFRICSLIPFHLRVGWNEWHTSNKQNMVEIIICHFWG